MPPHSPASDTPLTRHRAALCLLIVCLGTIASPMDSAVNVVFPRIISTFGRDLSDIRWVVISYVLTYASLLLIFGKLGDLFGYRAVFQAGLATNAAGIAACAFATSFEVLLAGRILQGLGAALVLSCAPALATSFFDETKRTRVLGIYAAMLALGAAIGPLAGGVLVRFLRLGRSVLGTTAIRICGAGAVVVDTAAPRQRYPSRSRSLGQRAIGDGTLPHSAGGERPQRRRMDVATSVIHRAGAHYPGIIHPAADAP